MKNQKKDTLTLQGLEAKERSIVISFLALTERRTSSESSPDDGLALSLALKAALTERAN